MIPPRAPSPYSSARASSALPIPVDCRSGRTTSSDRPQRPSRSSASTAPVSPAASSVTQQPPGSVARTRRMRTSAAAGSPGGRGGSCSRRERSWNAAIASSWAPAASSSRIGRRSGTAGTIGPAPARAGATTRACRSRWLGCPWRSRCRCRSGDDGRNRRDRLDRRCDRLARARAPGPARLAGFGAFSRCVDAGAAWARACRACHGWSARLRLALGTLGRRLRTARRDRANRGARARARSRA